MFVLIGKYNSKLSKVYLTNKKQKKKKFVGDFILNLTLNLRVNRSYSESAYSLESRDAVFKFSIKSGGLQLPDGELEDQIEPNRDVPPETVGKDAPIHLQHPQPQSPAISSR